MKILDTSLGWQSVLATYPFDKEKWETYIDAAVPGVKDLCLADMEETVRAGYSWEEHYLPVLNGLFHKEDKLKEAVVSFRQITNRLDEKIKHTFGKTVDVDIVLYLGLCNGAGWVTPVNGKTSILLGIEKIIELDWCGTAAMNGLILHELGHVYQAQYGVLERDLALPSEHFLWQLFTEGIAMVFEQDLIDDTNYFHQDKNGWKQWCDAHIQKILRAFSHDLDSMTQENQRYFGDWVRFEGQPDVGYYLGTRFVRFMMESESFDRLITYDILQVKEAFARFMQTNI